MNIAAPSVPAEIKALSPVAGLAPVRDHLPFLDGLRGLAALLVVFYHATGSYNWRTPTETVPLWTYPFRYGFFAVPVFIVLSGFVLMLPVVKYGSLRGGVKEFIFRRAKRILPPYYAALIVSIPVSSLFMHYYFKKGNVLMHFLLLHNLKTEWNMSINSVMWSVATEWQIYFVFALLLVPIWRKAGLAAAVMTSFVLGLIPHYLFPTSHNFDWAHPWFLGLFSLGMMAAVACQRKIDYFKNPDLALVAAAALIGFCCYCAQSQLTGIFKLPWVLETLLGAATAIGILACAQPRSAKRAVSILAHPLLIKLGAFSYSLYLFHQPVLELFAKTFKFLPITYNTFLLLMVGVSIPVAMTVSYLFYLLVEKRFTASKQSPVLR